MSIGRHRTRMFDLTTILTVTVLASALPLSATADPTARRDATGGPTAQRDVADDPTAERDSAADPSTRRAAADSKPNIVLIFTDDQGYADVGVFGAKGFETPHLDKLAAGGMRFTSFYVAQPVCSASRAALLTGCYPNRIGISGALGPNARHGISDDEVTLGELCKSRGYATAAYGKWHLGHHPKFLPIHHGFDEYYGTPYSNDMWPLHPDVVKMKSEDEKRKRGYPNLPMIEGDQIADPEVTPEDQTRFTTDLTNRAVQFIEKHKDGPFFVYLAHPMPHVPLFVSDKFKGKTERGLYGDVIEEIDWSVGQIMDTLRRLDLVDRTLVIYTSDNGPWLSYGNHAGSAGPLREGKGTTFEGGVREPCIVSWPGRVPAGSVCDEPVMTIDIFPTIARLIGGPLPEKRIDGRDIWPLMAGEPGAKSPHEVLYFYYHDNHLEALRAGNWKLILPHTYRSLTGEPGRDGRPAGYTYPKVGLELYDLSTDIGEKTDVAEQHPDVVERLLKYAEEAREDLGDKLTGREGKNRREAGRLSGVGAKGSRDRGIEGGGFASGARVRPVIVSIPPCGWKVVIRRVILVSILVIGSRGGGGGGPGEWGARGWRMRWCM